MAEAVTTREEILQVIRRNQAQIRGLGARRIGLFGSFVRGEQRADSDVDLLVEFERGQRTFDHFIQLSFLLETQPDCFHIQGVAAANQTAVAASMTHLTVGNSMRPARKRIEGRIRATSDSTETIFKMAVFCM